MARDALARQKANEAARRYRQRYPERCRASRRKFYERQWGRVLAALGGECVRCGDTGPLGFLDVDHIHGGGAEEPGSLQAWQQADRSLRNEGEAAMQLRYQLLCPSCHRRKTLEERRVQ